MLPNFGRFFLHFCIFILFRAIPEHGYITLGTIRYGVKLSQGCLSSNCTHFRSSSLSTAEHMSKAYSSRNSTSNTQSQSIEHDIETSHTNGLTKNTECSSSLPNVCDSDTSQSDVTSVNGSCCLNTTKCSLPWINKTDNARTIDLCKSMKNNPNWLFRSTDSNSFFFLGKFPNFWSLPYHVYLSE